LTADLVKQLDIHILPVIVTLGDKQFLDNVDITSKQVFEDMKKGEIYKTSQIPLNTYIDVFSHYAKENIPVINVVMSSGISSSYETSVIAVNMVKEEYKDARIYTIDSKCCSVEMGIAVKYMAMAAQNGKSYEEILKVLEFCKTNTGVLFTVSDLKYLSRGGRLSKASAFIGNMLNIKPILSVTEDGRLEVIDKVRSSKKVFQYIVDKVRSDIPNEELEKAEMIISYADNEEIAIGMKQEIVNSVGMERDKISLQDIGPCIGVHTGPDSLYVFYLKRHLPPEMYS
jgi:degV domain-containing protein yitS